MKIRFDSSVLRIGVCALLPYGLLEHPVPCLELYEQTMLIISALRNRRTLQSKDYKTSQCVVALATLLDHVVNRVS